MTPTRLTIEMDGDPLSLEALAEFLGALQAVLANIETEITGEKPQLVWRIVEMAGAPAGERAAGTAP